MRTFAMMATLSAVMGLGGSVGAAPQAPSMLGTWHGFGGDGSMRVEVTAQQGRRFAGELQGASGAPAAVDGTVSHEMAASEGINRVVVGIRPPAGGQRVFQGESVGLGDTLSGVDLLVGRTVSGAAKAPLVGLRLTAGSSALAGRWQGEVEFPRQLDPVCLPIVVEASGRTRHGAEVALGGDHLSGLQALALDDGGLDGFALVARGSTGDLSGSVLVLSAESAAMDLVQGTATLLPADGSSAITGSFWLAVATNP